MDEKMILDLSNNDYHASPEISSSDVKLVASKSLLHWKHKIYKSSSAFDLGSAVHALCLEPKKNLVIRGPEDRRGNKWKVVQLEAELDQKILLTEGDYDLAVKIADAVKANPVANRYLTDETFIAEASFFAKDPVTGTAIKCRPDGYLPGSSVIFDIKTTRDASPQGFPREIRTFGYDLQSAFYLRTMRAAGHQVNSFIFVAVEKVAPFAVGIHTLTDAYLADADQRVTHVLEKIKDAETHNDFTTGWPVINTIDLPRWQVEEPEEDVFDEDVDF